MPYTVAGIYKYPIELLEIINPGHQASWKLVVDFLLHSVYIWLGKLFSIVTILHNPLCLGCNVNSDSGLTFTRVSSCSVRNEIQLVLYQVILLGKATISAFYCIFRKTGQNKVPHRGKTGQISSIIKGYYAFSIDRSLA